MVVYILQNTSVFICIYVNIYQDRSMHVIIIFSLKGCIMKFIVKLKKLCSTDPVLFISGILASFSGFIIHPDLKYLTYIDYRVISILFMLMLIVSGLIKSGLFLIFMKKMISTVHTEKLLSTILVIISFFLSIFITNDVTLITIVPFTILLFNESSYAVPNYFGSHVCLRYRLMRTLIMETISANLGSMLLPIGNPQNLYLYQFFHIPFFEFIKITFPFTLISLIMLIFGTFILIPNDGSIRNAELHRTNMRNQNNITDFRQKVLIFTYLILFIAALLSVSRLFDWRIASAITILVSLIFERSLFRMCNYRLLITFIFFYIFIGNLGRIPEISSFLKCVTSRSPLIVSTAASQIISNVPAAVLFSKFTNNAPQLIIGTNIGGLGTLIASMASLITYQQYSAKMRSVNQKRAMRDYILHFTITNIIFLIILLLTAFIIFK